MLFRDQIEFDIAADMHSPYGAENLRSGILIGYNTIAMHGPYASLSPGRWSVVVSGNMDRPEGCSVDAVAFAGRVVLGTADWVNGSTELLLDLAFPADQVEFRVHAATGTHVTIESLSLARTHTSRTRRSFSEYHRLGLRMILDESSLVDRDIIKHGSWEMDRIEYLKETALQYGGVERDLVFLDVGAYFGLYSMIMAHSNLFDRIIAFEADRLNFRQLNANLLLNDPACFVETQAVAVSDEPGEALFASSLDHPESNRGGVGVAAFGSVVKKDRLDNLVSIKGRKIIAKIDVEGHEIEVLAGMSTMLASNRMLIQVETFLKEEEVKRIFEDAGYRLVHQIGVDYFYSNF